MFGKDKTQDDSSEAHAVPVSVVSNTTDTSTTPPPAAPPSLAEELNLPAPSMDVSAMHEESTSAPEVEASTDTMQPQMPDQMTPAMPQSVSEPVPDEELSSSAITINSSGAMRDLTSLKQEALRELSPLINQLDQTPDEKYATAKMVYEETNDQALLTAVYEAAKNLSDEKEKAEAIYDVVKKINEFTAKN